MQRLWEALENHGYKTFLVGGAVRDLLLGQSPRDFDLVVLAPLAAVSEVAGKNGWAVKEKGSGALFGSIMVMVEGQAVEVTTARREWYGEDAHRPAGVEAVSDLREDLGRRDFTINAMAISLQGEILDPFEGRKDLAGQLIRAVGNPVLRFAEDGLRAFRAARFAAQLGFEVEEGTLAAIPAVLSRVQGLSVERVREELDKILLASYPARGLQLLARTGLAGASCLGRSNGGVREVAILPELLHLAGLPQNPRYHSNDAWEHTLAVVEGVPVDLTLRWAALLHDVAKGMPGIRGLNRRGELADHGHDQAGAAMARSILYRLKVSRQVADRVSWLVGEHMKMPAAKTGAVLKWLGRLAKDFKSRKGLKEAVFQLLALHMADQGGGKVEAGRDDLQGLQIITKKLLEEVAFYRQDLAINGQQVARVLGEGPQVGSFYKKVLERVQGGELENRPESLQVALRREEQKRKG